MRIILVHTRRVVLLSILISVSDLANGQQGTAVPDTDHQVASSARSPQAALALAESDLRRRENIGTNWSGFQYELTVFDNAGNSSVFVRQHLPDRPPTSKPLFQRGEPLPDTQMPLPLLFSSELMTRLAPRYQAENERYWIFRGTMVIASPADVVQ